MARKGDAAALAALAAARAAPIDFYRPRYDQATFLGRTRHFAALISPSTLLTTRARLDAARALLLSYSRAPGDGNAKLAAAATHLDSMPTVGGPDPGCALRALWRAKAVRDAVAHPDTGEMIPAPLRMSAYVPLNVPIVLGMLVASARGHTGAQMAMQVVNQSLNAGVNYANRSIRPGQEPALAQLGLAYAGAVAASCGAVFGLGALQKRAALTMPRLGGLLGLFTPFLASASAGVLNVCIMRAPTLQHGVSIRHPATGEPLGTSRVAGRKAMAEVAASRVFFPLPVLVLPPLAMRALAASKWFAARPRLHMPAQLAVITACLAAALPPAIGLFPQDGSVASSSLEPALAIRALGAGAARVAYNKGL